MHLCEYIWNNLYKLTFICNKKLHQICDLIWFYFLPFCYSFSNETCNWIEFQCTFYTFYCVLRFPFRLVSNLRILHPFVLRVRLCQYTTHCSSIWVRQYFATCYCFCCLQSSHVRISKSFSAMLTHPKIQNESTWTKKWKIESGFYMLDDTSISIFSFIFFCHLFFYLSSKIMCTFGHMFKMWIKMPFFSLVKKKWQQFHFSWEIKNPNTFFFADVILWLDSKC